MTGLQMVQASETPEPEITLLELSRKLRGYHIIVGLAFLVSLAAFPGKSISPESGQELLLTARFHHGCRSHFEKT